MGKNINIDIDADAKKAVAEINKVDKAIAKMGQQAKAQAARQRMSQPGATGGATAKSGGGLLSDVLGTLPANIPGRGLIKGALSAGAAPFAAVTGAVLALRKSLNELRQAGSGVQAEFERMSVSLGVLSKNTGGTGNVTALTNQIHDLAINGVNDIEQLRKSAAMFMAAFGGSQEKVSEWLPVVDDMAASLGIGVEELSKIVARANELGKVEGGIFGTLKEKGLPAYKELAKVLGVSAEQAQKIATSGQVSAEAFNRTLLNLAGAFKGSSAALSTYTLQGAQDTNTAAWGKRYQAVSAGANAVMIEHLNRESAELLAEQLDLGRQAELKELGKTAGHLERIEHDVKKIFSLQNAIDKGSAALNYLTGGDVAAARSAGSRMASRYTGLHYGNATTQSLEELIMQGRADLRALQYTQSAYADADLQREFNAHIETLTSAITRAEKQLERNREVQAQLAKEEQQKAREQRATSYRRSQLSLDAIKSGTGDADAYAREMGWGNASDALKSLHWYNALLAQGEDGAGLRGGELARYNAISTDADALRAFSEALQAGSAASGQRALSRSNYQLSQRAAGGDMAAQADLDARAQMQALLSAGYSPAEAAAELAAWGKRTITAGAKKAMSFTASDGSRSLAVAGSATPQYTWLDNAYGGRRSIVDQTASAEYQNALKQTDYLRRIAENTGLLDSIEVGGRAEITAQ